MGSTAPSSSAPQQTNYFATPAYSPSSARNSLSTGLTSTAPPPAPGSAAPTGQQGVLQAALAGQQQNANMGQLNVSRPPGMTPQSQPVNPAVQQNILQAAQAGLRPGQQPSGLRPASGKPRKPGAERGKPTSPTSSTGWHAATSATRHHAASPTLIKSWLTRAARL